MEDASTGLRMASLLKRIREAFAEVTRAESEIGEITKHFGEPDRSLDVIDEQIPEIKLKLLDRLLQIETGGNFPDIEAKLIEDLIRLTRLCARLPLLALLELAHERLFALRSKTANPYRQREEILDEIDSVRRALDLLVRSSISDGDLDNLKAGGRSLLSGLEELEAKVKRSRRLRGLRDLVWLGTAASGYVLALVTSPLLPVLANDFAALLALSVGLGLFLWYFSDKLVLAYREDRSGTVARVILWLVVMPFAFQFLPESGIRSGTWPNLETSARFWVAGVFLSGFFFLSYFSDAGKSLRDSEVTKPMERIQRSLLG